jgi:hypothetical protein
MIKRGNLAAVLSVALVLSTQLVASNVTIKGVPVVKNTQNRPVTATMVEVTSGILGETKVVALNMDGRPLTLGDNTIVARSLDAFEFLISDLNRQHDDTHLS